MFCAKCGSREPDGTGFCGNCGAKMISFDDQRTYESSAEISKEIHQQKINGKSADKKKLIVVFSVLILIVVICCGVYFVSQKQPDANSTTIQAENEEQTDIETSELEEYDNQQETDQITENISPEEIADNVSTQEKEENTNDNSDSFINYKDWSGSYDDGFGTVLDIDIWSSEAYDNVCGDTREVFRGNDEIKGELHYLKDGVFQWKKWDEYGSTYLIEMYFDELDRRPCIGVYDESGEYITQFQMYEQH